MRSEFSGYFPVSEAQLNKLWAGALIVVDANTLLNLYRYNEGAREAMLRALEILKDRLWTPYQVAHEFHTNRPSVIRTQEQVPTVIRESLDQISNYIKSQLGPHKRNGVLDVVDMTERLEDTVSDLRSSAAESKFGSTPQSDRIVERLADILDGRTGPKFSTKQHAIEVEAGHQRIAENTPPGLRDANKAGDKAVGDYLLWRQLMNFSKSQGHDVLSVTDDRKDDWWWTQASYTLGPLPALREEFARETGQFIWFYRPARFLAELRTRNLRQVSDDDISAVRETSDRSGVSHRERPISASSLVVMSREVGQPGDWWPAADGGVSAVVIVEVQPAG
ncbi:PIN domain-containing protein [Pseudonocardia sp. EV170527-09]|uniref:PIN domain-containing protein n=1 Tax=Pseudonocardia sp. EV170527-09 TaxID=2603411 RepID=UPI0013867264